MFSRKKKLDFVVTAISQIHHVGQFYSKETIQAVITAYVQCDCGPKFFSGPKDPPDNPQCNLARELVDETLYYLYRKVSEAYQKQADYFQHPSKFGDAKTRRAEQSGYTKAIVKATEDYAKFFGVVNEFGFKVRYPGC